MTSTGTRLSRVRVIGLIVLAACALGSIVAAIWAGGSSESEDAAATPTAHASNGEPSASPEVSASGIGNPPVTDEPAELGRWLAHVVFGMDHRYDRDTYVDAIWAAGIATEADDQDRAREAFADDPRLAAMGDLVPDTDVWARLAEHEQWATFDVDEPIGVEPVDPGRELARRGLVTAWVLVTGTQTIHYVGDDGTDQTEVRRPALRMLIGCADEFDGCRLVRVDDQGV